MKLARKLYKLVTHTHTNMYIIYTLHFNSFLAFVVDILTLCICVISDWTRIACKGTFSWLLNDLTAATILGRNLGGREWWASCWQLAVGYRGAGIQVPLRNRRNQVVIQFLMENQWWKWKTNGEKPMIIYDEGKPMVKRCFPLENTKNPGPVRRWFMPAVSEAHNRVESIPRMTNDGRVFLALHGVATLPKRALFFLLNNIKQPRSMELNLSDPAIVARWCPIVS